MNALHRDACLTLVALVTSAFGFALVPSALHDRTIAVEGPSGRQEPSDSASVPSDDLGVVVRAAPFRASRSTAPVAYEPGVEEIVDAAPPPERPTWRLTGVMLGNPTVAVFEGLPEEMGAMRLLAQGDSIAGYAIAVIAHDSAVVEGRGTRWTFKVESTWR